jgi:hypothetical protein
MRVRLKPIYVRKFMLQRGDPLRVGNFCVNVLNNLAPNMHKNGHLGLGQQITLVHLLTLKTTAMLILAR